MQKEQDIIEDIIINYGFKNNKEQEKAFHIVANHISSESTDQLKLYMAGMAGTGKSQIIKALKTLFIRRNEGGERTDLCSYDVRYSFIQVSITFCPKRFRHSPNLRRLWPRIERNHARKHDMHILECPHPQIRNNVLFPQ